MKLVVFMPAYNEERRIGKAINHIWKVLKSTQITKVFTESMVLVLDDSSLDNTKIIAEKEGAKVIQATLSSKGVGYNIQQGLPYILLEKPDVAVGIDADGQFDPDDLPRLIAPILKHQADMVTGTKFTDKKNPPQGISKLKLYGNYLVVKIINVILRTSFTDVSCGYRAYSKKALLNLNLWGYRTYVQEALIDLHSKGLVIKEIPIKARYYPNRKSRVFRFKGGVLNYAMNSMLIILRATRDYRALSFFGTIAIIFILLSFIPAIFLVIHYVVTSAFFPYTFLGFLSAYLFTFGMIVGIVALFSDMISRVRKNQEKLLYYNKKQIYFQK